jgi:hypothetical protein
MAPSRADIAGGDDILWLKDMVEKTPIAVLPQIFLLV